VTVPEYTSNSSSCRNPIGIGKSTAHDAHDGDDDELQKFSKGVTAPYFEMRDGAMSRVIGSIRPTKARRRCEVRTLSSSPNISPATLIDGARNPVWDLNSWHIERTSIIRWQGICEVAPPTLLLARNPRAAERDTPSTSTRGLVRPKRRRRLGGALGEGQCSTEPVRSPLATFLLPTRPIAPIRPEMVAINRLDQAQKSIGPLPIMGRTLPITVQEPDRRSG
jgi:hypothetical protein